MSKKPKNLNLFTIRFPVPAIVSIMHRMSGVIIFLLMPFITIGFSISLMSSNGFANVISIFDLWPVRILSALLVWGTFHHFIAGCRHLLLDMQIGNDLIIARLTSKTVLILSFIFTALVFLI
jgi:succinate dehydrogenase / fumarate reductase cytochrome b subunit